jgi:hypothetical protein
MKKTTILSLFILIIITSQISYSQIKNEPRFYIGLGTSISTFIGGDFGSTFSARYYSERDNYYNDYYYPGPYTINELHNYRHESFFPLQVDLAMGVDASRFVSLQVESSFIWHLNGNNFTLAIIGIAISSELSFLSI